MLDYRVKLSVDVHDVDYNGVAKASSLMKYMQTAAQNQLTDAGLSYDELKERNKAFILSRFKMDILKPLYSYAPLTALTFPCESRGFGFMRCYALLQDDQTVARAISMWGLIDIDSKALVPVNNFDLGLTVLPPMDMGFEHFVLPADLTDIGGYGVHYGDVDRNRHMNNTRYPDMYSNFLPLEGKMIRSITINYINEAQIGEKLRVQRSYNRESDTFFFRTVRGDGKINSSAKIDICNIV